MDCYIYQADIYCETCGEAIRSRLTAEGFAPEDPDDETTYDSGEYPKGPYPDAGGESDTPSHCGSGPDCLAPTMVGGSPVGQFLEGPLTSTGVAYVAELIHDGVVLYRGDGVVLYRGDGNRHVLRLWLDFYWDDLQCAGYPVEDWDTRLPEAV